MKWEWGIGDVCSNWFMANKLENSFIRRRVNITHGCDEQTQRRDEELQTKAAVCQSANSSWSGNSSSDRTYIFIFIPHQNCFTKGLSSFTSNKLKKDVFFFLYIVNPDMAHHHFNKRMAILDYSKFLQDVVTLTHSWSDFSISAHINENCFTVWYCYYHAWLQMAWPSSCGVLDSVFTWTYGHRFMDSLLSTCCKVKQMHENCL